MIALDFFLRKQIKQLELVTVFGRLELELCERKILLLGWWLEAEAGGIGKRFTVALEGYSPAERSEYDRVAGSQQ